MLILISPFSVYFPTKEYYLMQWKKCFNLRWMSINAVLSFHYETVLNAKLKVKSQEKLQTRRWPCELRALAASEKAFQLGKEKFADFASLSISLSMWFSVCASGCSSPKYASRKNRSSLVCKNLYLSQYSLSDFVAGKKSKVSKCDDETINLMCIGLTNSFLAVLLRRECV